MYSHDYVDASHQTRT